MSARSFQAFGVIVVSLDLLGFCTGLSEIVWDAHSSPQQKIKMSVAFFAILAIGFGLIELRKWAAIYFSLPLFCVGFWVAWSSIEQVSFPWNLLWMVEGVSLMLPAVVTARLWPYLSWGGRWFF